MKRNVIIYHHNDLDGIVSGSIIYEYEKIKEADSIECKKVNYSELLDLSSINRNTIIYFVDYSFSGDHNMNELLYLIENDYTVVWIDHHKSSYDLLLKLPKAAHFTKYLSTDYCASILCFKWCYANLNNLESAALIEPESIFLKYVDSWDTWKHNMPNTTEFNTGTYNVSLTPETVSNYVTDIFVNKNYIGKEFVDNCIIAGGFICGYLDNRNNSLCKQYGFEFKIYYMGKYLNCFALNGHGASTVFGSLMDEYDVVCLFRYNGEQFIYSLYSSHDNIECDVLSSALGTYDSLGGGGHKGAAGFQTYNCILSKDVTLIIKKKLTGEIKVIIKE